MQVNCQVCSLKYAVCRISTSQNFFSLLDAELEIGIKENYENKNIVSGLEQCSCPAGYKGLSCEDCDYGYVRLRSDSTSNSSVCSLCDCNGHSQSCDFVSGQCDVSYIFSLLIKFVNISFTLFVYMFGTDKIKFV